MLHNIMLFSLAGCESIPGNVRVNGTQPSAWEDEVTLFCDENEFFPSVSHGNMSLYSSV